MNWYRWRVVERTITTKRGGVTVAETRYYLQRSVLGIMWTDEEFFFSLQDAIDGYNSKTQKVTQVDKVVHPPKNKQS